MLSDEEKKAIVGLKHFSNMTPYWKQEEYTNSEINNYIKLVLNLIEKQSQEIEELKENNKNLEDELNKYIVKMSDEQYRRLVDIIRDEINKLWQDKIKARIKELEEYLYKGSIKDDFLMIRIKSKIQELQSLLEKKE